MIANRTRAFHGDARTFLLCAAAVGGFYLSIAPAAQAEEIAERVIEEVYVTARRKDETLQDVPVTITSVGGDQLQNFQLDQPLEIAERIPNFNIQAGGSGSGGTLNLRGVGSSAISAAFDSAVAIEIDDVVISRMRMVQSAFMDIEQVDVLKGPQSLYFGKSASAGVLSFRTANPGEEVEGKLGGGYDFELEGTYIDAMLSGPLTDNLGARVALRWVKNDKIWENEAPGFPEDRGEEDINARVTLVWDPSDRFSANFKTTVTSHKADDAIGNTDILCIVPGDPQPSNFAGLSRPSGYDCDIGDGVTQLAGHNDPFNNNVAGIREITPFEDLDTLLSRVRADWLLSDNVSLTSVTSYFEMKEEGAASYGYDINGIGSNYTANSTEAFAQEFRLAASLGDRVDLQLGAFYQDRELIFDTSQEAVGGANLALLFGLPTGSLGGAPSTDPNALTEDWRKTHTTDAETLSFFGSITAQLTDRLEFSGGVRWSDEKRRNEIDVGNVHYIFNTVLMLGFVPNGFNSGTISFDDDLWSPEASLLYRLNDNVNVFAAYKTGYKAGGIDNSALPSASLAAAAASGDFADLIYATEEGKGFEVGMKGRFADGSLRLDVTAFSYVYDDLQVQSFNAQTVQFSTANAGELESKGIEATFTWLPPVDGLSLYGAFSYLDAAFSESFIPEPPAGITDPAIIAQYDLDGRATSGAADFAFNVGLDFYRNIPNSNLEWGFGINTSWTDDYETQNEDPIGFVQDSFWLLNARVSIGAADGRWMASIMGRNLGDELYVSTSGGRPFADTTNNTLLPGGVGLSDTVLNYSRGRQVFAQLEFNF
ncbi:MAG: TonB-dependent receptor [Pseudomonadota bacterium]